MEKQSSASMEGAWGEIPSPITDWFWSCPNWGIQKFFLIAKLILSHFNIRLRGQVAMCASLSLLLRMGVREEHISERNHSLRDVP